ncbi:unnamed protein product, partial [Didymodactylos carnosus]
MRSVSFRSPINFYNDQIRYYLLLIFHLIDFLTFFIRLTILCAYDLVKISKLDTSHPYRKGLSYLILIIIFESFGSLIIIFSNFLYLITKYCIHAVYVGGDTSTYICCRQNTVWHLSTITCFKFKCYSEHPQGILLTRLVILVICFFFRFLSFMLGASCANRYSPLAVAYTSISSISLVLSTLLLTLEFIHFFRLWTYRPNNDYIRRLHRSHARFIPYEVTNDPQSGKWTLSLCPQQDNCKSESLHHLVFYHSTNLLSQQQQLPESIKGTIKQQKYIIAYYQTTSNIAYQIAYDGFPKRPKYSLELNSDIFFTLNLIYSPQKDAIFYVRLNIDTDCFTIIDDDNVDNEKLMAEDIFKKDSTRTIQGIFFQTKQKIY